MAVELRQELLPPVLDKARVSMLADLAARIDGATAWDVQHDLAEFNRIAGTELTFKDFQGIYGGEEHETWVRRLLSRRAVRPAAGVTREELIEVVRRAMPDSGYPDYEAYMAVFDANVSMPGASNLIYYPADYDHTRDWQTIGEYGPTPEEIVDEALRYRVVALPPPP